MFLILSIGTSNPPFLALIQPIYSSFFELTCFALSVQYVRMIATVNVGSAKSRGRMNSWFEKWETEKKRREKENVDKDGVVEFRHQEYW